MKKYLLSLLVLLSYFAGLAQAKKNPPPPHTGAAQPSLKSQDDSISYAIGLSVASFFRQQNVQHINTSLVEKAINDIMKSGSTLMNEQQANSVIMACMNKAQAEKTKENAAAAEVNKKAGEAFLAANKTKTGVVTLPSGLQYEILTEGNGPKPAATDKIKCHYQGTLLDGTIFDSSIQRGEPLQIGVDQVIPGWAEALQLMPVGSKWRLFVPSNLAYGDRQAGATIKPGSTLIFEVELLEIVK
jgi:FKBP-type peptidyl-prolyl cis-trans isomerase FklB